MNIQYTLVKHSECLYAWSHNLLGGMYGTHPPHIISHDHSRSRHHVGKRYLVVPVWLSPYPLIPTHRSTLWLELLTTKHMPIYTAKFIRTYRLVGSTYEFKNWIINVLHTIDHIEILHIRSLSPLLITRSLAHSLTGWFLCRWWSFDERFNSNLTPVIGPGLALEN